MTSQAVAVDAERCTRSARASKFTRCRCTRCRALSNRSRKLIRVYGEVAPDRSGEGFAALDRMLAAGRFPQEIAETAGLDADTLRNQIGARARGGWRSMSDRWADALVAAEVLRPSGGRVRPLGTQRRLRALARMGWGAKDIAEQTGLSFRTIENVRRGTSAVEASFAEVVRAAYGPLSTRRGPDRGNCSAKAALKGWAAPAAWDDIDDPGERPKGVGWGHLHTPR